MQVPYYQPGQLIGYTHVQQPVQLVQPIQPIQLVQPTVQVPTSGSVQQPGPSTPRTPTQTTAPIYVQPTTPIP